jgi:hypothetical protein
MAKGSNVECLRVRKQALLLESGLNRLEMGREVDALREQFSWLQDPVEAAKENSPLLLVLAPVAGVLVSRLLHRAPSGRSKLGVLIDVFKVGWPLWRQFATGYYRSERGQV